ncbi:hypothetical protein H4Q26_016570 [Puccinia striiformis f. sp. tritici PST-130]|nr:hypothetical protein H4Q26_016570 [Puccinia striiformis f. sp. tritici PST-130]
MDVSRVLELLNVLYPSPNTPAHALPTQNQQTEAQKALYDLMAEPSAWSLASEILDSLGTHEWAQNTNARFIAAHTLAVKISRDWTSFPADQSLTLKDRLLQWLQQSVIRTTASIPGEKIVLRKLSVAISVLSFKLVPEPSRCWDNWLLEVISRLASGPTVTSSLLDVLTVIAEEAERADMLGARRVQYDQSIHDGSGLVIRTLSDALVSESYTIRLAALTCSQAQDCRYGRRGRGHCPKSADCIEELVSGSRGGASIGAGFVTKARAEVLLDWFGGDLLGSIIEHSVACRRSARCDLIHLQTFYFFIRALDRRDRGEPFVDPKFENSEAFIAAQYIPGYGGIDENISTLILPIWTLLQEELNDLGYLGNPPEDSDFDPPPSLIQENYPELRSLSTELFKTLAQGLKLKSTWPKQHFIADNWTKDMAASFKSHTRADLAECLLACYYVCRDELLLDLVMETKSLLSSPQGPDDCYEDLEACLFCIRAIQDGIPSEENTALPLVVKASPEHLLCSLNLVAPSLTSPDPETISLAANALRRLCHEGRKVLVNEIAALAELIRSTEGKIMPDEYNKVLQAVASVLQALPAKDLVQPILSLMEPVLTRLNHALRQHSQAPDPDNRMVIITQLQQLKACNQGLSEPDEELILLDIDDDSNPEKKRWLRDVDMAVTLSELARSFEIARIWQSGSHSQLHWSALPAGLKGKTFLKINGILLSGSDVLQLCSAIIESRERVALQAALDILRVFAQQTHKASPPAQADLFLSFDHPRTTRLNHIVLGISGKLPRSSLPSLSETLHCFVIKLPHLSQMWLTQLMQTPGYPNEKLTEEKKVRFLKNICAARTLKKARDVCTDFAIVSRGLEGTAYGASQMSLSFAD